MGGVEMLIKTITCHDVYNHGATLQAFALMKYLQHQGHDTEIINYKPDYLSGHYKLLSINHPAWNTNLIKKAIYLILKFPGRLLSFRRKIVFDIFTRKYLKLTPGKYNCNEQLKENPPEADVYICGSDQIWNCLFPNGKDPAFYLDFVTSPQKKKVSYAASFATTDIPDEYRQSTKERIDSLNKISVRESSGIKVLESLGINRAIQVVDPVFLLDKDEWASLDTYKAREDYLLVYDFDKSELLQKAAIIIAKEKKLKIYSLNDYKCTYADKCFPFAGPEMFVSLIKNAKFVISNSFHGTAFSIIFEKNFYVINRSEKINTRMADLLRSLGLEERLVTIEKDIPEIIADIDYSLIDQKMKKSIIESKQFLNNSINEDVNVL